MVCHSLCGPKKLSFHLLACWPNSKFTKLYIPESFINNPTRIGLQLPCKIITCDQACFNDKLCQYPADLGTVMWPTQSVSSLADRTVNYDIQEQAKNRVGSSRAGPLHQVTDIKVLAQHTIQTNMQKRGKEYGSEPRIELRNKRPQL